MTENILYTYKQKEEIIKRIKLSIDNTEYSLRDGDLKDAIEHLRIALKDLTNIVYGGAPDPNIIKLMAGHIACKGENGGIVYEGEERRKQAKE